MATQRQPAEVFPPGAFLSEELEERGWTQEDLATITGMGVRTINEIVMGKRGVTPKTAHALAAALGTSPEFWINLESAYKLWRVRTDETDIVARRSRLYTIAPINHMLRRGWISPSDNIEVLESQVKSFFRLNNLAEAPTFGAYAARKSAPYDEITPAQCAWLFRASQLSRYVHAERFSLPSLNNVVKKLKPLMYSAPEARHVPRTLAESGIKLVVVEHLPGTKIDGATFWVDKSPVIAMSIRYDRIDNFWFTLLHELGHIKQGTSSMDINMDSSLHDSMLSRSEQLANTFAADQAVLQTDIASFVARVGPLYRSEHIRGFAKRQGIHPGIVVGQLHHRREIVWSHFRRLLVSIRPYVIQSAVTDGWGSPFPAEISSDESERR